MRVPIVRLVLLALVPSALVACHDSGGGGGTPLLTNLGLGVLRVEGRDELWALAVTEFDGGGDRNGDGDTRDVVVSVLDLADGSVTDLGLAYSLFPLAAVGDNLIAFGVPEAGQGDVDLNGDGDTDDIVLHVYDARARTTTNSGLALGSPPAVGAGTVAFGVSESDQDGTDLDGSGSAFGAVLHIFDARTGLSTNAQRNLTSTLTFHDHAFAFTTDEASAGEDLNGNGELDDGSVFQLFDTLTGGVISVPLTVIPTPLATGVDDWVVLVSEVEQGEDLNGDGDEEDGVYFSVEPHLGTFQNLGLSAPNTSGTLSDGTRMGLQATEIDGDDQNGDTDLDDSFAVLLQPGVAPTFVASLANVPAVHPLALTPAGLAFLASEELVGDLNGNGVGFELILHLLDAATGQSIASAQEALTLQSAGDYLVYARFETSGTLQEDRNGDGDTDDLVHSWWNPATSEFGDTGLAGFADPIPAANALLLLASEDGQGSDLNGDGDLFDDAWVWHDLATGTHLNLRAAGLTTFGSALLDDGRGVLLVSEESQGPGGTDLNGDGDAFDLVVHTFRAR